jgi:pyruvate formate lyase activating enzyme
MFEGVVFDIKEFAINDGPGIRLTVFFKGCPLRCVWCHNPEGFSFEPQVNLVTGKTTGKVWTSHALADYIYRFRDIFDSSGGGITFSGGEPTAQAGFLLELVTLLPDVHKNLDTSGFCSPDVFLDIFSKCDLVFFDLKLGQNMLHEQYTGHSNKIILKNLQQVSCSAVPYHIRIPLIPNVTDTEDNCNTIKTIVFSLPRKPESIDLLPYNRLAGGKYNSYGIKYLFSGKNEAINEKNIQSFINTFEEVTDTRVEIMK